MAGTLLLLILGAQLSIVDYATFEYSTVPFTKVLEEHGVVVTIEKIGEERVKGERCEEEPEKKKEEEFEIVDVVMKVTESGTYWTKYSWAMTIKNNTDTAKSFNADIRWLDTEGFLVNEDYEYNLEISAGEEKRFAGYDHIKTSVANTIESIDAQIKNWRSSADI